jgi:hypothetical protein
MLRNKRERREKKGDANLDRGREKVEGKKKGMPAYPHKNNKRVQFDMKSFLYPPGLVYYCCKWSSGKMTVSVGQHFGHSGGGMNEDTCYRRWANYIVTIERNGRGGWMGGGERTMGLEKVQEGRKKTSNTPILKGKEDKKPHD